MLTIDAIHLREINLPLAYPFEIGFGRTTARRILLVEIESDGLTAWGECAAGNHPDVSEESIDSAWMVMANELAPRMVGREVVGGGGVPKLLREIRGNKMAKAALENAVWDLEAQKKRMSLAQLLGGTRPLVSCGVSIGIQPSPAALMEKIAEALEAGYQHIKLDCKPGWDTKIFEQARKRWPEISLSCDGSSEYRIVDIDRIAEWDEFNLQMIEQPLWYDDFYFHSMLQKRLDTPICLDESIRNRRDALAAIDMDSCRVVNIKAGRVGGFSEAIAVHNATAERGVPVWCGGMGETGIGRAHDIALASLPNFSLPCEISDPSLYWDEDMVETQSAVSGRGEIAVPDAIGSGCTVSRDRIEALTVRNQTVAATAREMA